MLPLLGIESCMHVALEACLLACNLLCCQHVSLAASAEQTLLIKQMLYIAMYIQELLG